MDETQGEPVKGAGEVDLRKAGIAAVVAVVAVIFGATRCGSSGPDEYDVQATCKDIVRKQMKNPSTARFSGEAQTMTSASGTVVAENVLGGKVTHAYRCTVQGEKVVLKNLTPVT
jgi:hypothetical protein